MGPQAENLVEARRAAAGTPGVIEVVPGGFGDLDTVESAEAIPVLAT